MIDEYIYISCTCIDVSMNFYFIFYIVYPHLFSFGRDSWVVNLMCNVLLPFWNNQIIRQVSADIFLMMCLILICWFVSWCMDLMYWTVARTDTCRLVIRCTYVMHVQSTKKTRSIFATRRASIRRRPFLTNYEIKPFIHRRESSFHTFFFELFVWWPV